MSKMIYDYELVLSVRSRHMVGKPIPNKEGHRYSRVSLGTVPQVDFSWFEERRFWCDPDPLSYQPWFSKVVGWDDALNYLVDKGQQETVKAFMESFGNLDSRDWLIEIEAYVGSFLGREIRFWGTRDELYRLLGQSDSSESTNTSEKPLSRSSPAE